MAARRISPAGMPAACATASAITPSSAPCRSSPRNSPARSRCSGSVARSKRAASSARRAACEPTPEIAWRRVTAASTSRTSSVGGGSAGVGRSRSAAQPTPTVPCGSSPERYATAIPISSGDAAARHSASRFVFASRDDVAATSADACAMSASSISASYKLSLARNRVCPSRSRRKLQLVTWLARARREREPHVGAAGPRSGPSVRAGRRQ